MRKNRLYRPFMMIAGVLAAVVILFSQSFYHQAQSNIQSNSKKIATEQSSDQDADQAIIITAPSDAVVNSSVENENVQIPSLLEELFTTDQEAQSVSVAPAVFANLFKTFFRAVISPNAP